MASHDRINASRKELPRLDLSHILLDDNEVEPEKKKIKRDDVETPCFNSEGLSENEEELNDSGFAEYNEISAAD